MATKSTKSTVIFSELENIHIKDVAHVENVIENFVRSGTDKLQVISDFDMTLTRFKDDKGNPCDSCYQAIDSNDVFPQSYKNDASLLKDHYYSIEIDPNKTIEEKVPYMVEWWNKAHDLMVACNIHKESIPKIIRQSTICFRDGCDWMLERLHDHRVPLLVFSAGVGDIIEEVFRQRLKLYENIKIVSNFMHFNDKGLMDGFVGDLLHVFNKNESFIHQSDYFRKISNRGNVLLMGDSLGDLAMAEGVNLDNILKIGFLNHKIDDFLESYINSFDIVVVDDQTMNIPNDILKRVCLPNK